MNAWSLVLNVSILQGVTQWKGRVCAAELTVASSFAQPACVLSMVPESVAVSLQAVARRIYFFQEALKASEMWGDYEQKVICIPVSNANVTLVFFSASRRRQGLAIRKLIRSQFMRTTSVLINVSLCLSIYCTPLIFFFQHSSYLCVFNNECEGSFTSGTMTEFSCWCISPYTVINCTCLFFWIPEIFSFYHCDFKAVLK